MTNYAFATWSPCEWTKLGQSLDFGKSEVCPLFVHSHFTLKMYVYHSIPGWDKFWTNIRHMSNLCPAFGNPRNGSLAHHPLPTHSPDKGHFKPTETNCGNSMDYRLHPPLSWLNKWAVVPVDSPVDVSWYILSKYNQKTYTLLSGTKWVVPSHFEKKFLNEFLIQPDLWISKASGSRWWRGCGWAPGGRQEMGPRPDDGPKARFWGCQKREISWTYVWYLSKINLIMEDYDSLIFWKENGSWTKGGHVLDFLESRDRPTFVH